MQIRNIIKKLIFTEEFPFLQRSIIELNSFNELNKIFGWKLNPILDRPDIYDFDYIEDVNERRIRDAESLAAVMRNVNPSVALEIGTSSGMGTVLMSINAPKSKIYTLNIPPEDINSGLGGNLTTIAIERDKIGIEYRKRDLTNIIQIFVNSANWVPKIGTIDVAYIDGCHDTEYVFNDTKKILPFMKKNGFILWHDFNIELVKKYDWINSVCLGVEKLLSESLIRGRIFHIKDSWSGICQINI